ncbi:penicillin-binding protein 1B [Methylomarinovum tepidoasis]|uniref:Penicillin-binding protein 1B n=1 Tax=Methylomarinovum tepidoasis TaxID=2840183 RepID=A0AAU9CYN9_9GAMM|nr:penicillin-binding protein 1B [Methylomarinovum sp. IN45]BCX89845.1 penicillin-binding protein 1B [Methylomarinovum sp. IN45]
MTKASRRRRAVEKRRPQPSLWRRWLRQLLWGSLACAALVGALYLAYLDYRVRHQFEGRRWTLPASVYAVPVELYPGAAFSLAETEHLLTLLNYRRDRHLGSQGSYYRRRQALTLRTRAFRFPDGPEDSQRLRVRFRSHRIAAIEDLDHGGRVPLLRLEPVQIGSFYPAHKEDRILVKLDQVPPLLIQTLLAVEDRDFYRHHGLSPRAIARALWADLRAGRIVQGGSTLTQQLVKNFFLSSERRLTRKLNEALMALILEARYDKDEILEAYLNEIYLGQDGARAIHGFGLASEYYFSRSLGELQLPHIALLVGLVRGPAYYDPRRHPERALKRRNLVLDILHRQGIIDDLSWKQAKRQPLDVTPYFHRPSARYPAFLDLVKRQLRLEYPEEALTSEGLKIFTTLDIRVQDTLERTVGEVLPRLEKGYHIKGLQTAAVVTRRGSGEIVAFLGGRDPRQAGFNRAIDSVRPVGSLIKPAVYLTALMQPERYTLITSIPDTPVRLRNPDGTFWRPHNYDRKVHGQVPLHTALAHSYNLATVHLGMEVGLSHVARTVRRLGVSRPLKLYPSMLLGAASLTPLEVAQMYQTLANQGFAMPLRAIQAILANDGTPLQRYPLALKQTLDSGPVYLLDTVLEEVMTAGTGSSAYRILPKTLTVAGKTGTTNGLRDSWFAGFSGDYLAVTWIGRDDNRPTRLTGARGALQIWARLFARIARKPLQLPVPETVEWVWIDPQTGRRADDQCPGAQRFPFIAGSAPEAPAPCLQRRPEPAPLPGWLRRWF